MNTRKLSVILASFLIMGSIVTKAQNKIYVNPSATGLNDGTSWTDAYTVLDSAFVKADTSLTIDSILIAGGKYTPLINTTGYLGDRNKTYYIKRSNLSVIGSYDASSGLRDFENNKTIFSGEIGDTLTINDNINTLLVVAGSYGDTLQNVLIDGIRFEKAYNNSGNKSFQGVSSVRSSMGGGIYSSYAQLHVKNSEFAHIKSDFTGAAIAVQFTDLWVDNCLFKNNVATYGAAIFTINAGKLLCENSVIDSNIAGSTGSGIVTEDKINSAIKINNNHFKNNGNNTLLTIWSGHPINIEHNTFEQNNLALMLIYNYSTDTTVISNNKIFANQFGTYLINIANGKSRVENNLYSNNYLSNPMGTIINIDNNDGQFSNNTFVNNRSSYLIYSGNDNYPVYNTIAYKNIINASAFRNATVVKNSYLHNVSDTSNGNIDGTLFEPEFVQYDSVYTNANFNLNFCSPLIDKGDTSGITYGISTLDINGNPRLLGNAIDIGAYEKQSDISTGNYINNASLTDTSNNNTALLPICDDGEWTYYTTLTNSDSIVLGINWGTNNALAKSNAQVYVNKDASHTLSTNNNYDSAIATLSRNWHIDLGNDTLVDSIHIRFFFSDQDTVAIMNAFDALNMEVSDISWFVTPTAFNASTMVVNNTLNGGNYSLLNASFNTVNTLNYVELTGLQQAISGSALFKGTLKNNSVRNINTATISIVPNPATDHINIENLDKSWIGKTLVIADILGRKTYATTVEENTTINVSTLAPGTYIIQIDGIHTSKFVKL